MIELKEELLNSMSEDVRFFGDVEGGFCWETLTRERMKNAKSLEPYGYKVYSQNDEDGIIQEIFNRIGTTNKKFIEFGVQDGLESNTHLLLFYDWSGLWIEGSSEYCEQIKIKFRPVIENGQLKICNAFITRDNINGLFAQSGFSGDIDLLSIDIDGNDLYVWDAIDIVNPRVVITEYNGKFPPDLNWCQAYDEAHIWRGIDWHGASLKAFDLLAEKKGYKLVGTDLRGCNAFFVRNDLVSNLFYEPQTAEALYNPLRLSLNFKSSHPSRYCLANQKENYGLLNYQNYELKQGFFEEEQEGSLCHAWMCEQTAELQLFAPRDIKMIEVPYSIPREVLAQKKNFSIQYEWNGQKKREKVNNSSGKMKLWLDCRESLLFSVIITVPELWTPKELLNSGDDRMLGLDIILSEISMKE